MQEGAKDSQSRDELPRIEDEIRVVDRAFNSGQSQLDRGCYDQFLFTKTFRNTPQCKDLARQVDVSKRRLSDLEARRQDIIGSSGRSYQDDIIRELARNNCGANYVDMARRRSDGMWEDEASGSGNTWSPRATNGAQTYRTLCVRLCDGFYFPVSFSTLPSHFPQDADVCSSKCAAPTELFYYPNPGGTVEQAVALKDSGSLHEAQVRIPLPQGIRQRLLVQDRRVCAGGWGCRQEGGKFSAGIVGAASAQRQCCRRAATGDRSQCCSSGPACRRHRRLADAVPAAIIERKTPG